MWKTVTPVKVSKTCAVKPEFISRVFRDLDKDFPWDECNECLLLKAAINSREWFTVGNTGATLLESLSFLWKLLWVQVSQLPFSQPHSAHSRLSPYALHSPFIFPAPN